MTPLLGTKTSSTPIGAVPAGDGRAAQTTVFQVFTRPETRDTALAWREAQAGANSEVFTNHETRNTNHGICRPSVPRGCARVAQSEAAARDLRARRPVTALLRAVAPGGAARERLERHGAPEPASALRQPFPVGLQKSAFRWKSRESVQNPASHRKMREAQCSPRLAFPSGLGSAAANAK